MTYQTATAMAEFDQWSRRYDRSVLQRFLFRPSHDLLLEQLTQEDQRLLDIGCGTGVFAVRAAEQVAERVVCGLDLSAQMLEMGQHRTSPWAERLWTVRGESQRLPFSESSFDVVTCSHSFHHYPDQQAAVNEMFRVLRPGGRLLIIDGDRDNVWGWFIFDVLVTSVEGEVHHCSAERMRTLYRAAGFRHLDQKHRGHPIPFLLTQGQAEKPAATQFLPLRRAA